MTGGATLDSTTSSYTEDAAELARRRARLGGDA